jgi:hypothetical protein
MIYFTSSWQTTACALHRHFFYYDNKYKIIVPAKTYYNEEIVVFSHARLFGDHQVSLELLGGKTACFSSLHSTKEEANALDMKDTFYNH